MIAKAQPGERTLTHEEEKAWREALKVGDEVVISGNSWNASTIEKIDHVTSKYVCVGKARFRRVDGYEVGTGRYSHVHIDPPTPHLRDKVEFSRLASKLRYINWQSLPLAVLRHVDIALEASLKVEKSRTQEQPHAT